MKIPATKNGNSGIRNLTNEPKFATVKPTEKAKNMEKSIVNNKSGFFPIRLKKPKNFSLNKSNNDKNNK